MSIIEKQMNLSREMFEINTHVMRRMVEITGEGIKQYMDANQDYAKKLTEVRDVTTFVELQREYGTSLYNGMTERLQTRGEVLKEAFDRSGAALRETFSAEKEEAAA